VTQVLLQDVTFLQVLALRDLDPYYYGKTMALMLQADEDGATYRRVGIVELPDSGPFRRNWWESRIFTFV
jgi:hypothetical protein